MNLYLDNIVYSLQSAGGISVYWYELSKRLLLSDNNLCFIEEKEHQNIFRRQLSIPADKIVQKKIFPVAVVRYLPVSFKHKRDHALFHSSYYRTSLDKELRSVVTVHDFTYERMKKGFKKEIHRLQKKSSLDAANGIMCVSEHTKADMLTLYPHLAEKKISVINNGVSNAFFPLTKNDLLLPTDNHFSELAEKPYILFIGSRDAYKNFAFSVNAVSLLSNYHLFIVGGGKLTAAEIVLLTKKLPGRWHCFLGISNEKLNKLYNFARFLLYPSAYEGFGIPVIEAERAGCPVIALAASSIPEMAGNKELLLQSLHAEEFLEKVAFMESNRDRLIANGFINSRRFSWDKCYEGITAFYQAVLQD